MNGLICSVSIERHGSALSGFTIRLYDSAGPMVGSILWVNFAGHGIRIPRECAAEKRALLADQGLPRTTPLFYGHTEGLNYTHRGMGLGQWMLAESARIAWVLARGGIMQDKCRGGYNSGKSIDAWNGRLVREYVSFGADPKLREDYGIHTQRVGCWADRTPEGVANPPALPRRTSIGPSVVEISLDYDLRDLASKTARPNPGGAGRKKRALYARVIESESRSYSERAVEFYDRPGAPWSDRIGVARAVTRSPDKIDSICAAHALKVRRSAGMPPEGPTYVVVESDLDEDLRGAGLGAWLYAEVARLARRENGVIVADACSRGDTSSAARNVWGSARLAERAIVSGLAAAWPGRAGRSRPNPPPPGFDILPYERPSNPLRRRVVRPNPGGDGRKICLPVRGFAESSLIGLAEVAADGVELDARDVLLVKSFSGGKLCFRPEQRDDIGFALHDLANAEDAMAEEMTRRGDSESARFARAARDGLTGLAQKVWRS